MLANAASTMSSSETPRSTARVARVDNAVDTVARKPPKATIQTAVDAPPVSAAGRPLA